ncbi:MAG: HTTM domain-containing protein [Polyangiales bacterium]|nr:HTTM domain-containing protein [Myxococcales bacterium]
MTARSAIARIVRGWNTFFFAPFDLRLASAFRMAYAALVLVDLGMMSFDLELFFGVDGVMPLDASRAVIDPDSHTVFELLPQSNTVLWTCYVLALLHAFWLLIGLYPRVQAAGVFFWLLAFHDRNLLLFDGEDQVFRLFAFFLIFLPTHRFFSVHALERRMRGAPEPERFGTAWALRLFQIQMTLVYFGAAWAKLHGPEWLDGTALWYVSRLDDSFGRFPLPSAIFDSLPALRAMTWGTLAFESALPIALWIPRTRKYAIVAAFVFHLSLDYAMYLFLFHPLMSVGLLTFLATDAKPSGAPTTEATTDTAPETVTA